MDVVANRNEQYYKVMYAGVNRIGMVLLETLVCVTDLCASRLIPTRLPPQLAHGERGPSDMEITAREYTTKKTGDANRHICHARAESDCRCQMLPEAFNHLFVKLCETVMAAVIQCIPSSDSASFTACTTKNLAATNWWCNHALRWLPPTLPDTWLPFFFSGATARIGCWPLQ